MTRVREFEAMVGGEAGERPLVELPFDVRATYGEARPKVKVTVNGVELRTTVAVYGGRSYVGFRQEIRDQAGFDIGDRIRDKLEPDEEERTVEVPEELARALARNKTARASWDRLSFSHRNEYAKWITEAKKPETRARRIVQAVEMLKAGRTR